MPFEPARMLSFGPNRADAARVPASGLIRDALGRLNDPAALQRHPLVRSLASGVPSDLGAAAGALRTLLLAAIEHLRPIGHSGARDRAWQRHQIMALRYIEGLPAQDIYLRLAIGKSSYHREHRDALAAISAWVEARLPTATVQAAPAVPLAPANVQGPEPPLAVDNAPLIGALLGRLDARTPLVGRDAELRFLQRQYDAVASGEHGRLVLLGGEPGVGKTRLAHEVGQYARGHGGRFLVGHYLQQGGAPYLPWCEALRPALQTLTAEELKAAASPFAAELSQIFPELAGLAPLGQPPPPPEEQRVRLYDGVTALVQAAARQAPLVLLLDDIHWAPSLDLLAHVGRRLGAGGVLLLAAFREQEMSEHEALTRERMLLTRLPISAPLSLAPLSETDTAQMIAHHSSDRAAAALRGPVYRRSRGNPFVVEEALRLLVDSGSLRHGPQGWEVAPIADVAIPATLRLLVEDRVGRLGPEARNMLDAAAVLGQEFDLSILQGMTAVPETELVALLERAIAVRIVADHSEFGAERFAFSDDQIQEVLYAALSGPRRRRLHRQAGMALEQRFGEQTSGYAEQLARHFGEGADLERGARYARQAGEAAEQVYAWAPAARWYRTALAQWERLGSHLSERASLCERLGDLYHRTALDARLAAGYLEQAIDLAEQMGDRTRAAGTRFYLGRSLAMSADIGMTDQERALTELHRARTTLEDLPESELLGWVFMMIGAIHGYLLQLPERVVWLDRALGVADRLGLPALRANVEANLGVSFYLQGDVARGLNIVEGAWEQAAQKGLAFPADRARSNLVLSLTNLDPRLGLAWADRSPDFHTYPSRIEIPGSRCCQLARMGDFAAADQLMRRLLETLEDSGLRLPGIIPFDVGQFYYCRGEWETARDLLEEVWALFKRTKNDNWAVRSAIPLGEVYLELGEDALAEELLEWTAARCREGGAQLPLVQAQLLRAVLAARQGRAAEAAAILDDAQTLLGAIDDLGAHMGVAARAEAIVRAAQGRWSEAETAFLRSIEIAQRFGLQWDEAKARHEWGRAALIQRAADGEQHLAHALAMWEAMGAGKYAQRLRGRSERQQQQGGLSAQGIVPVLPALPG